MKRLVVLASAVVLSVGALVACEAPQSGKVDQKLVKTLTTATENLKKKDDYMIQNTVTSPDGQAYYLEGVHKGDSWTDYPVNSETGELSMSSQSTSYTLVDWVDKDGSAWVNNQSSDGTASWVKYTDSFGKFLTNRVSMYADVIIPNLKTLEKDDEKETTNVGDGDEDFTIYNGTVKADDMKDILGVNTKKLYESIVKDVDSGSKSGKKAIHLCKLYLDDIEKTLVFSDADIKFYVKDKTLRGVSIVVGGLGSRLTYTRTVALNSEYDVREKPDEIDNATDYIDSMKELADFADDYDNYDDMVDAYNKKMQKEQEASDSAAQSDEDLKATEKPKASKDSKKSASKEKEDSKKDK